MSLVTGLLLACNHERVDLRGYGAAGSRSLPSRPPAPDTAGRLSGGGEPTPPVIASPAIRATLPAPFLGVTSRGALVPPIAGGTLAVAADGGLAVLSDADRDAVFVIDPNSSLVRAVQLPERSEPGRVVLDDIGQAHVVLRSGEGLARIDLKSTQLTLSGPLCQYPRGIAYAANTQTLHVACADGQLLQLSAADHRELARERHEPDLRDVLVLPDGSRVLSRFRSAQLLALKPSGERTLSPPVSPWPRLMRGAGTAELGSVDTSATFAFRTAYDATTGVWMLHERAQLDALDAEGLYHGQDTVCGPVVQPALSLFSGADDAPSTHVDLQLQGVAAPAIDLALSAGAQWVAIATPAAYAARRGTLQLQQLDLLQKQASIPSRAQAEAELISSPVEVCSAPSFISLEVGSQAVAVAFDQNDRLYVQTRFPARLDVYSLVPADAVSGIDASAHWTTAITLASDDPRDLGHEWFHAELGTSRLSCAACHAEALDDGHTWISGAKARRTPNLRGGILQTAPYFWGGEWDNFAALLNDVVGRQIAAPNLSMEAADALLGWLNLLPPISLESDAAEAARGKLLFESNQLACTSCHNGSQLTNNRSVSASVADSEDAGVPDETLQVPSLLGLALRAPYMHDGCATDLTVLFREPACARGPHRKLAALSGKDAADLQAYLLSL